ncbi:MAG: hypothetical protein LKF44_08245 [Atopobiaceae bacterium]|nr:hypothetical protein [Atopobiaceae bacterium]
MLLQKADEELTVQAGETVRGAVEVAIANSCRKRGKKPSRLFEKVRTGVGALSRSDAIRKMRGIESVMGGTNG